MFPNICGFILNYRLVKTFKGCVCCQVVWKEIRCCRARIEDWNDTVLACTISVTLALQQLGWTSWLFNQSWVAWKWWSVTHPNTSERDKEKNVRNKALKSSYQQPLHHKIIISSLKCLHYWAEQYCRWIAFLHCFDHPGILWPALSTLLRVLSVYLIDDYRKLMEFELNDRNISLT